MAFVPDKDQQEIAEPGRFVPSEEQAPAFIDPTQPFFLSPTPPVSPGVSDVFFSQTPAQRLFESRFPTRAKVADIAGMGITLGEALTGRTPLTGGLALSAGESLREAINVAAGVPGAPLRTPAEATGQALENVLVGALGQKAGEQLLRGAGGLVRATGRGGRRLFSGRLTPSQMAEAQKTLSLAEQQEIPLTPGQITQSPALLSAERELGERMQPRREQISEAMEERVEKFVTRVAPRQTKESFGEGIQEAVEKGIERFRTESRFLYDTFKGSVPEGVNIPLKNVKNAAEDLLSTETIKPSGFRDSLLIRRLRSLSRGEEISPTISPLVDEFGRPIVTSPGIQREAVELNPQSFVDIRSDINDFIQSAIRSGDKNKARKLVLIKNALDRDLESFADIQGGAVKDTFDVANAYYRKGASVFNDKKIQRIVKSNPESVHGIIVKPNAVTDINIIKKAIGQNTFRSVQRKYLEEILKTDGIDAFSPSKFVRSLEKYEPETLDAVLGPKTVKDLKDFSEIVEKTITSPKVQPSLGSRIVQPILVGGRPSLVFAVPTGGLTLLPPAILSRLYLTEGAPRFLIEGMRLSPNSKEGLEIATRLGLLVSGGQEIARPETTRSLEDLISETVSQ